MICSEAKATRHPELVPKHDIKTSSANAYVFFFLLAAAISALSNLFGERLNEQMVEQDEERRFKAKKRL